MLGAVEGGRTLRRRRDCLRSDAPVTSREVKRAAGGPCRIRQPGAWDTAGPLPLRLGARRSGRLPEQVCAKRKAAHATIQDQGKAV